MDLSTSYMGLRLKHPFILGASPLASHLDTVKQLEDAGTAAIVLPSLFEEQVRQEQLSTEQAMDTGAESSAEVRGFFPARDFSLGPEQYLEHIRRVKECVKVPVIASLNGITKSGWIDFAKLIEKAGADALELNVYFLAADPNETGETVEKRTLEIAGTIKRSVGIPVAVKLSPFYSSIANVARSLDETGIQSLVLFNRFYQPDFDMERLETVPTLSLSDSSEVLLRLRWVAMLYGRIKAELCISGGVHTPADAIKSIMAGAQAVQMVSAVMRKGPSHFTSIVNKVSEWMQQQGYESIEQMRGNMSHRKSADPAALERANYARVLQSWRPEQLGV